MSRHLKIWATLLILSLALPAFSLAQTAPQKSATPQAAGQSTGSGQAAMPPMPTPPDPPLTLPEGDQTTNIPYFTLRDGMNSTLTLNNNTLTPVPVSVTIYNMQGRSQVLQPITLDPHSFKQIELRDVVASELFDSGNVAVSYHGTPMLVTCQLSVYSTDKRVSFESRERDMMDFESASLNGILSLTGKEAQGFLAVTNVSTNRVTANVTVGSKTKEMELFSRETKLIEMGEEFGVKAPATALVKLTHNGLPGDIITTGFVIDLQNGYSSAFTMFDPKVMRSSILAGAHIRFGQPDPSEGFPEDTRFRSPLLLANVSDKPVNAHISVDYTVKEKLHITPLHPEKADSDTEDKANNVAVKDLTVAAGDVQRIELSEEMARFHIDGPVEEAGVEIAYDGAPGAVIAHLTSVDQSGDYSFEVPVKDPSAIGEWPQGVYPWTLENGVASTVHLKNFTDKRQLAMLEIRYAGGSYSPNALILAPHQTVAIDIRKLKDSKTPDERGQVIPADVTHGQVWWGPIMPRTIIGRNEEVNVTQGIASSFSCMNNCCGPRNANFQMVPGSATMLTNSNVYPFVSQAQFYTCDASSNYQYYWANWQSCPGSWSSDSSVATIVNGSTYFGSNANITTSSAGGTANITASIDWSSNFLAWDPDSRTYYCGCAPYTGTPQAPLQVQTLGSLQLSVTSTPVSGQTNSVVSGQAATVSVTAIDNFGNRFTQYTGTVHFASTDTTASLPSNYTFTTGDAGTHTFNNVTLKTVSGTNSTRDLGVNDTATGISATINPLVWFYTTMDVERWKQCNFVSCPQAGSYFCQTSCQPNGYSQPTPFISVTKSGLCNVGIVAEAQQTTGGAWSAATTTTIQDCGPAQGGGCTNPYWNTGTVPAMGGCLTDQLATNLGIPNGCNGTTPFGVANVLWRFQ